ncbi:transcriptional regulator [Nocardiopsis terrae]|uniref:Transcriptional regulator with XRE-family HTH domain n=1 Tax=Nocardiopsis terrae TaxID=372655 RepID=A0ABR9HDM4_9ACTN|nr:helix-turn-helix transcriptional regulator [Nocardiopsis terrae]MBE1457131.1 transcriptional regulator with XRE-family HTH domain [Nocardiopsis terrae]GHC90803.1 transcriptional regulator [Nocardiopsis terrae]
MSYSLERARHEIGRSLRELRTGAGLTGAQLAELVGWSQPKVSRLETGRQTPTSADVQAWAGACGRERAAEEIVDRLRVLESMYVEWRLQERSGMQGPQNEVLGRDSEARERRVYECTVIPGILQTEPYIRAVLDRYASFRGVSIGVDEAVRKRLQRQETLYSRRKRFRFLLTEGVLHTRYTDRDAMVEQLDRLTSVSALSNVSLGIIPFDQRVVFDPGHGFWIHDDRLVTVETLSAELRLTHPSEVEQYVRAFDLCARAARYGQEARSLILRAIDALNGE